ncbi:hypothetical protein JX266_006892 [Neoarthrinium moseri]|nr:hypothetical protein JX266_006892 [Neoarthrinium moseri]
MEAGEQSAAAPSPGSVTGQKRPRDYGEALKGLTPDRESEGDAAPSAKRSRTDRPEDDDAASDSLDDGEIVEDPALGGEAAPTVETAQQQELNEPEPTSPPPGPEADTLPQTVPEAPASPAPSGDATVSHGGSEANGAAGHETGPNGESADVVPGGDASPDAPNVGETEAVAQTASNDAEVNTKAPTSNTWNQGVGLGLRTSFARPTKAPAPTKAPPEKTPTPPASVPEKPTAKAVSTANTPSVITFSVMKKEWRIDASKFEQVDCQADANILKQQYWANWARKNIDRLATVLEDDNQIDITAFAKPSHKKKLLQNGMRALAAVSGGILSGTKNQRTSARSAAALAASATVNTKLVQQALKRTRRPGRVVKPMDESSRNSESRMGDDEDASDGESMDLEIHDDDDDGGADVAPAPAPVPQTEPPQLTLDELEERRLYFPGSENYPIFCTHCVSTQHNTDACPQLTCAFCGSKAHSRFGCPSKQRCGKCRQVGHSEKTCSEKLALAKEEMSPCAYCGDAHIEDQCNEIWRSFDPAEVQIRKVKAIPAFCYVCGNEGHYGPECGLVARAQEPTARLHTWSVAARDLFVDPSSPNVAIAWVGLDMRRIQKGSNLNIRGAAKKATHIQFVSSDDSDDDFIKDPIRKAQPPGRGSIKINTTTAASSRPPPPKPGGFSRLRRQEGSRRENQREPECERFVEGVAEWRSQEAGEGEMS